MLACNLLSAWKTLQEVVMRTVLSTLLAFLLLASLPQSAYCEAPYTLNTAWLVEHEAFAAWYARQNGWDVEAGFRLDMKFYASGRELMADMQRAPWQIAACGALPALTASLENAAAIIAIGNDESLATGIYVRKDSPMLGHTGYNALYPEMAGTTGTVRGRTILCTLGSSAHYTVHKWLAALGLTEKDVILKDMSQEEALRAFLAGEGDAVALWAPYTLEAERNDLQPVTLSSQCAASQPTLILANKAFAHQHPERVRAFLSMYFRGIAALQETPREKLLAAYADFQKQWTGKHLPPQDAAWELARHPIFGLDGQLALFAGKDQRLQGWLRSLTDFAGGATRLGDVTDQYLRALAGEAQPAQK